MVFSSMTFLWVFLPLTLILYFLCSLTGKMALKNAVLLIMSLIFYTFGEPKYIVLLLTMVLINYMGGLMIGDREKSSAYRRVALIITIVLSLLLLFYFKYYMLVAGTLSGIFGRAVLPIRQIALPIGISFYTFQALSYTIDLYRDKYETQKSFPKLLLYISFFPQLIAGPIVRYGDINKELSSRTTSLDKIGYGVTRFAIGLGKKVILANTFALSVDKVFALSPDERGIAVSWYALLLYCMQIYFDFSGYSDMAIGLGKIFGFNFAENFRLPYLSTSIREYWRRWHISLSTWFREYVYIPLGGNRKGRARTYLNLFIVFFLTGLWHGAGWNYVLWGMAHGIFIVAERFISELRKSKGGEESTKPIVHFAGHIYCILTVMILFVLFRTDTLSLAAEYYKGMVISGESALSFGDIFNLRTVIFSFAGILLCIIPEDIQLYLRDKTPLRVIAVPAIMIISIILLAAGSYNPFIYFRF